MSDFEPHEGPFTCDGCGVPMHYVAASDRFNGQPIFVWKLVDENGRSGTNLAPDGRNIYEILNEMSDAIQADCKQAKKKGNSLQLSDEYVGAYSLWSSSGINPFRHNHRVVTPESKIEVPWHCGEPMWLRPTGWHCRKPCQDAPFKLEPSGP